MGRPPSPCPAGFDEAFIEHGWEAKDLLGMDTPRFKRLLGLHGADLKQRRKNYVMGRRLSSLKVGPRG